MAYAYAVNAVSIPTFEDNHPIRCYYHRPSAAPTRSGRQRAETQALNTTCNFTPALVVDDYIPFSSSRLAISQCLEGNDKRPSSNRCRCYDDFLNGESNLAACLLLDKRGHLVRLLAQLSDRLPRPLWKIRRSKLPFLDPNLLRGAFDRDKKNDPRIRGGILEPPSGISPKLSQRL